MRQHKSVSTKRKPAIPAAFLSFRIGVLLWEPDARFEELLEFLCRHRKAADEVAFFTSPIHPVLPLDVIERRAAILKRRVAAAKKAGFRAGINFLSTIGHCDEYLHLALHGPYTPIVGMDGARAGGSFCPNGENLREYVRHAYEMMAQAGPEFIWLDDDLRIDNHRPANRGCCCETCLRLFADAFGQSFTREELRAAFDAGTPAEKLALRRAWIAHNARSLARLLALIEQTVHKVNPAIALGLMTGEYFYDGYDFATRADILAGPPKTPVKWRPGGGFYWDHTMDGLIGKAHSIGRQVSELPAHVLDIQSEIENFPYQPLKKATYTTALESAAYIAAGCTGTAYNVLQPWNEPLDEYEPLARRLAQVRPFLNLLARTLGRSKPQGVCNAWKKDSLAGFNLHSGKWLDGGDFGRALYETPMELSQMGIPLAYAADSASATTLSGDIVCAMDEVEIRRILAGGVYMDGQALTRLNEMGHADLTGFTVDGWIGQDCAELLSADPLNGTFSGRRRDCIQSFYGGPCAVLTPLATSARALAHKVERTSVAPSVVCMGAVENPLGGRVVVAGYAPWTFLQSAAKAAQMKTLFRWLSHDAIPGYIDSYHRIVLWVRPLDDGRLAAVLLNASLDTAEEPVLLLRTDNRTATVSDMACKEEKVRVTETDGAYQRFSLPVIAPWNMSLVVA